MRDERQATLEEYVGKLPSFHSAAKEFKKLKEAEADLAEARAVIERMREPVEAALRFEEKQWGTSHAKRALKQILAFLPAPATEGGDSDAD